MSSGTHQLVLSRDRNDVVSLLTDELAEFHPFPARTNTACQESELLGSGLARLGTAAVSRPCCVSGGILTL